MGWTAPRSITALMGRDGTFDHRAHNEEGPKMGVTTLGIDLAKSVFRLHGCDAHGRPVLQRQLGRRQLLTFFAKLPRCVVAMEACATAHYWAREIEKLGHLFTAASLRDFCTGALHSPGPTSKIPC